LGKLSKGQRGVVETSVEGREKCIDEKSSEGRESNPKKYVEGRGKGSGKTFSRLVYEIDEVKDKSTTSFWGDEEVLQYDSIPEKR
jgi:hypothetical protein